MVLEKVRKMVSEMRVDIPNLNIDTAHHIRPKKDKKTRSYCEIILKFLDITRCCLESEKKLKISV